MSKKTSDREDPTSVAYADGWVEKLRQHLPETVKSWDAEAIHHSRVATRRLAAALDVLKPVLSKGHRKAVDRALRQVRRQLGPLRDLDVMLDHIGSFRSSPGVEWLRAQLEGDRTARRAEAAEALHPTKALAKLGTWWAVRQEWVEAADAVDGLMSNSVHLQLDAFAEHAAAVTATDASAAARDPHELRIAGKALRYTLEMAVASGHPLPAKVATSFKRMQDALGAWHDMVVLAERCMRASLHAQLAYHDAALYLSVQEVSRTAVRRSMRHLAAFGRLWGKKGASLADTIRTTFPVARDAAATEPETGPDRPGSTGTPDPAPPAAADPEAA
jgi:CHAD domain-containing protein